MCQIKYDGKILFFILCGVAGIFGLWLFDLRFDAFDASMETFSFGGFSVV